MANKKIKIAILAPMVYTIPPKKQGGTEWIVYHQANGLVERGYDVTLFALRGSKTKAHLIAFPHKGMAEVKLTLAKIEGSRRLRMEAVFVTHLISELFKRRDKYDLIFNHIRGGEVLVPLAPFFKAPIVHVLHLPIFKELAELFREYNTPLIAISHNQKKVAPDLNYVATIYNGVDTNVFTFNPQPEDFFFTIGTIGEHKDPALAVLAARELNLKLILAGRMRDEKYFEEKIKPYLSQKIKYIGEIGLREKIKYFQKAKALIFTPNWSEPFGLVMIEAMACGTPVIATRHGAVPEVVKDGVTGFIVDDLKGLIEAIKKIDSINRLACRERVERKFRVERMIDKYEEVIKMLLKKS
jgi:glycosyltransferase involved in cell wall biosynthesis